MHARLNWSSASEYELNQVVTQSMLAEKLASYTKYSCDKTVDWCLVCAALDMILESERRTGRHE